MKTRYSEATLTEETLSDGSIVYGVFISGDYDIEIGCRDKQAAENLIRVWNHSVISLEISLEPF